MAQRNKSNKDSVSMTQKDLQENSVSMHANNNLSIDKGKARFCKKQLTEFKVQKSEKQQPAPQPENMINTVKECDCAEILLINPNSLANYPIRTVLKSLFNIDKVDFARDATECVKMFKERTTKLCCKQSYRILMFDINLKESASMITQCRGLATERGKFVRSSETGAIVAVADPANFSDTGKKLTQEVLAAEAR